MWGNIYNKYTLEIYNNYTSEISEMEVKDVPAHGRGVGIRWSLRSLLTQATQWLDDDSVKSFSLSAIIQSFTVCL